MGQRSQIYVRYNGQLLFASYYQWNYGERMISRARWGIEYMKDVIDNGWNWAFSDKSYIEKFRRIFDVNFDMHDVAISCDIVKECEEQFADEPFNEVVFNWQDNNDGQLYVDIQDGKIYYCFRYWERANASDSWVNTIMDANAYMEWDMPDWENNQYIDDEQKEACRVNIEAIGEMAELMTHEQLNDFLTGDYEPKPF